LIERIIVSEEVEIILSFQESPLKEILTSFKDADFINIVTYNLSENSETLESIIEDMDREIEINVITNIPTRWDKYYPNQRDKAKKSIEGYMNLLDPKKYHESFQGYFNFNNHSKIFMSDKIAYIGSANFSDKSQDKFECGVIFKNPEVIKQINDKFIKALKQNSIGYYGEEPEKIIIEIQSVLDSLNLKKEDFHEKFFEWEDGDYFGSDFERFIYSDYEYIPAEIEKFFSNFVEDVLYPLSYDIEEIKRKYYKFENFISDSHIIKEIDKLVGKFYDTKLKNTDDDFDDEVIEEYYQEYLEANGLKNEPLESNTPLMSETQNDEKQNFSYSPFEDKVKEMEQDLEELILILSGLRSEFKEMSLKQHDINNT
jgi:hypothetical protein